MNAIELNGVSVCYRSEKIRSLKELVVRGLRPNRPLFYSLRGINLGIAAGESVGIIGANGAGKSTLLRVAAGIIQPSEGVAISRGNIVPLMELGTGFEAELSGRENIHFNGALLGRSRAQMRSQIDAIIDFSGIGPFVDAPLRTYSTGTIARLAFSIATAVDAETILLDEILAVGDAGFRERCDARIQSFVREGRTVVLVSHDTEAVRALCKRTVWLSHGEIVGDGKSEDVIREYQRHRADEG
ncbi:MAG: lipopolysaccharide transport system ATP-binding protein [Thermoanaerobaculia bacterium]|jgi:ABC-type polysaccharide/polyol phosphate transport system ATPase subunit|nr:lipopolysaccharide transport system ATP-binding protein [Thermoanaerobaculia bacterium]